MTAERRIPSSESPFPQKLTPDVNEGINVGDRGTDSGSHGDPESRTHGVPDSDTPKYLTLVRSEARLRDDQMVELASLRRRVAAARTNKSERITDNTLLRIAVDLLLLYADHLTGDTEDELRRSLLGPPDGAAYRDAIRD